MTLRSAAGRYCARSQASGGVGAMRRSSSATAIVSFILAAPLRETDMDVKDVATIHEGTLEPAIALTARQLRQADQIVSSHTTRLPDEQHTILVAAVLQALATNFHALHTGG
jgi:hypothetical protein